MHRLLLPFSLSLVHFAYGSTSDECATLSVGLTAPAQGTNRPAFVDIDYGDYDYSDSPCEARVVFYKHKSILQQYATTWTDVSLGSLSVFRLSYGLDYQFEVYSRDMNDPDQAETLLSNSSISIAESAWPYLTGRGEDEGFVTSITGSPTWELLAFDVDCTLTSPYFVGFVFVDTEGDIVWLWNITTPGNQQDNENGAPSHVIDQFSDYSLAVQTMVYDAPIQKVSTKGEVENSLLYDASCGIVTHEARVVGDLVFTFKEVLKSFEGLEYPNLGNILMAWDFSSGEFTELYNLFDYFPPTLTGVNQNTNPMDCNNTHVTALDWSHANSLTVSAFDKSYILSSRALSTVCSFKPLPDLGGLNWCISPENPSISNFTFESSDDMFSGQHAVVQLSNGNLLMMDNSVERVQEGESTTSRGIEYELDWDTMVIKVVWQYQLPYTNHEGSNLVIKPDGEDAHKIMAVPDVNGNGNPTTTQQGVQGQGMAVEVDSSANEVSTIMVNYWFDSFYRGTPFQTIHGETKLN